MKKVDCILLIDDNEDDNEFHQMVIEKAGVSNQVRTAENGVKGLEYIINSSKPELQKEYPKADLIFLDINMPRMNGFEFLKEYHHLDETLKARAVICMLTTSLNPDDKKTALDINEVSDFRQKPLTVEMLHEVIEKFF